MDWAGALVVAQVIAMVGKSGWWVFIALVPLVGIYALVMNGFVKGTQGDNTFGLDPLASPALEASPAA